MLCFGNRYSNILNSRWRICAKARHSSSLCCWHIGSLENPSPQTTSSALQLSSLVSYSTTCPLNTPIRSYRVRRCPRLLLTTNHQRPTTNVLPPRNFLCVICCRGADVAQEGSRWRLSLLVATVLEWVCDSRIRHNVRLYDIEYLCYEPRGGTQGG